MNIFKKYSSMTIFYVLFSFFVAISTAVLVINTWNEVKRKAILELRYSNDMVMNTFNAELQQHEILIRLLGNELSDRKVFDNPKKARDLIENLLNSDKSLAGFGIARSDGQLVLVSFIPPNKKLPNLLENPVTRSSFEKIFKNKRLTLGRTYFMPELGKWVIPMRIPIFDKEGRIALVMTAGIDLEYAKSPWKLDSIDSPVDNVLVGDENYFIYASKATKENMDAIYNFPLPKKTLGQINVKELRKPGTHLFSIYDRYGKKQLVLSSYNDSYGFISASLVSYSKLYRYTYEQLVYFVTGIVIFYVLTLIFYIIANKRDKKHSKELLWTANHDILTKLPNRYFLQQKIVEWNKIYLEYSVLFMDLDDFKYINDNYGHPFGDELLIIIAQRLKSIIKLHEFVIRQGGDEFIILTSKSQRNIDSFAKHILYSVNESVTINNITLHPKISIGIAHYPQDARGIDALLSKADMALYKAKKNKLGYFKYSKALEDLSRQRLEIELELRAAVDNNELYVLLQPQIDAKTLQLSGVEALVRWKNEKLGFMPPDKFIKIAEEIGEIHRIGAFVLQEACSMCMEIYKKTNTTFTLSVNASVEELLYDGYLDGIMKMLTTLNFPKELLIVEVTESMLIHDVEHAKQVLSTLKGEGIGVSLDDFGTGYSSLSMLNGLPITELKIDQSFIRDILIDNHDLDLVKSIIMLAKIFNLKTVAEGVEEEGHIQALQDAGCSILQGYHFAKPLTKEELIKFIC